MNKLKQYVRNVGVATVHIPLALAGRYKSNPRDGYIRNVLLALDEWGNAVTGGDPNETISSRSAKARLEGRAWGCAMCAFLGAAATAINFRKTDHCADSIEANVGKNAVLPD